MDKGLPMSWGMAYLFVLQVTLCKKDPSNVEKSEKSTDFGKTVFKIANIKKHKLSYWL